MEKLLLLLLVQQSSAVIYHLNLTEYSKLPELFEMDEYDACVAEPGGTYCLLDADLYSKEDSGLMRMIQEYSAQRVKHFNHTVVHRAFCVHRTCRQFVQNRNLENEAELRTVLEECVDDAMWKGYKLNARLTNVLYCKRHGEKRTFGVGDYVVASVYSVLIILNAIGTAYDIFNGKTARNSYLLAFSLRRNWRKLVAPSGIGPEPRLNKLRVFNGLRTLTMICVFFSHTALVLIFSYIKNPYYVETAYDDPGKYILFNGTLVTHTFFVMSGFLLAFNLEIHAEKHRVSLWDWPRGMLMRWLRLTPVYALVMFTIMTLNRHFGDGPLWDLLVTSEASACNQYWWAHLLYINNYVYDDSHCFPQTWYLAADTQLFGLGLLLCILCRKPRTQTIALSVMLLVSMAIPAVHIYFQDLGPVVQQSPETYRSVFKFDDTFHVMFVGAHTNLSTYTLGIGGGLLAYHWLKKEMSVAKRLQKYPWVLWLLFPTAVGTILSGGLFYMDQYEPSMLVKIVYGAVHKPLFQLHIIILIICCIFKVESVYRGIVEWRGFAWAARASYGGFLLHSLFQRGLVGSQRQPAYLTDYTILTLLASTIFLTLSAGALLFVTVESPLAAIIKTLLSPPKRSKEHETTAQDATTKV